MKKFLFVLMGLSLVACDNNKVAQENDTVVIDFSGFLNGNQFEGGTAENFKLKLGSGKFVPGFEEQLIGLKKGEEKSINITFPEQYLPNLAGKEVVFKVKIKDIIRQ